MNPYREAPRVDVCKRRALAFPWHKTICYSIAFVVAAPAFALHRENPMEALADCACLPVLAFAFFVWIIGAQAPARKSARMRMCRIFWNCGQRDTAVGVSIGWIPLRLSQKRKDRNARALERFVEQRRRERRWSRLGLR